MAFWQPIADFALRLLREGPRYMVAVFLICAALLFLPERWLAFFSLLLLAQEHRGLIALGFAFSAIMVLSYPVHKSWNGGIGWWQGRRSRKAAIARLNSLDNREKQILTSFVADNERTRYFYFDEGAAVNLVRLGILFVPPIPAVQPHHCPFTIHEWAWRYLHEHPECLKDTPKLNPDAWMAR